MEIRDNAIKIRVRTGAPKTEIIGWDDDVLRITVKSHPEKGKANAEIINLLKKELKKEIKIIKGLKSKNKIIKLL